MNISEEDITKKLHKFSTKSNPALIYETVSIDVTMKELSINPYEFSQYHVNAWNDISEEKRGANFKEFINEHGTNVFLWYAINKDPNKPPEIKVKGISIRPEPPKEDNYFTLLKETDLLIKLKIQNKSIFNFVNEHYEEDTKINIILPTKNIPVKTISYSSIY